MMKLDNLKPSVSGKWLLLIAGVLWTGVSIMLCDIALFWMSHAYWRTTLPIGIAGCLVGILAYRFGFLRIAQRNMRRIRNMRGQTWIIAFQSPRSYIIMAIMIVFGTVLRHSAIPREYLAAVYLAVGSGLLLASLHYYWQLVEWIRSEQVSP